MFSPHCLTYMMPFAKNVSLHHKYCLRKRIVIKTGKKRLLTNKIYVRIRARTYHHEVTLLQLNFKQTCSFIGRTLQYFFFNNCLTFLFRLGVAILGTLHINLFAVGSGRSSVAEPGYESSAPLNDSRQTMFVTAYISKDKNTNNDLGLIPSMSHEGWFISCKRHESNRNPILCHRN